MQDAVLRATTHSPYLAGLAARWPEHVVHFSEHGADAAWAAIAEQRFSDDAGAALRQERGLRWLIAALADLSGAWPLERVVQALSAFADAAIDRALHQAFAERAGGAAPEGLAVIALGKHGSAELNFSSDIDPILLFDPETMPRRERDDPAEAAVRIGRRLVELLAERTADGFVFRVDLRLRPASEVTPIVLPVEAAISHYESQALAWEQAAFIRARAAAGDVALGRRFLAAVQPFVWRRALDFGQIKAIGDVSQRIRRHYAGGQAFGPGFDLKRGRGGIREVEFYAQVHQLIHGGRTPALRAPATCAALGALGEAGVVAPDAAATLAAAYRLYRTIEHRLQMIGDQQTHSLPKDAAALDAVAALHGLDDGAALIALLAPPVAAVGALYDQLIGGQAAAADDLPGDEAALARSVAEAGFADGAAAARLVQRWRSGGTVRALRSPAALAAMEQALPALLTTLGHAPDPMAALLRFDRMLEGLPSALNLFDLLAARPDLRDTLSHILCHAPTLADELARKPALLDALIDRRVLAMVPIADALHAELAGACAGKPYEAQLDSVRLLVGDHRFALGVQLIEGMADPLLISRAYSDLADAALHILASATIAEFEAVHGRVPGSALVILALGRFGGRALTHASDLDLIYLFTGDFLAESDGAKPLGATLYYNRLAQRIGAAMSVPTASGRLYEVDTRLRPSGKDGPLVVSVESFLRYQREEAWTWEHMALTRARIAFGPPDAGAALEAGIADILKQSRDAARLIADAVQMRADMAAHKPPAGPLDVKMGAGGLVDLEFALHVTQLRHARGFSPILDDALTALVAAGLAPPDMAEAHALLARLLVVLRLMAPAGMPDAVAMAAIARIMGHADWDSLMRAHDAARAAVGTWWQQVQMAGDR